ncbi:MULTISPECIES: PH domain-containing protein [Actinoalloteichus]|uniref:YdbS-like PH domain-containing protein n=1 Tax=Actinoalloteichus fjordicus TaxID=1612552 RepID=A0AAC9PUS1_9PSEU|nr:MULTISPECIES: PH domain-containing protein [Actinoalloteichus]APU17375.1 hypothetical protein UA74_26850 [Actinoalloteichus fjordicus]APU23459.1 hypothetical protein UA75_27440 [Actinoalloteichus sp. GBA129-24]
MGYPENMLTNDEHVVVHKHSHWKMIFWPTVALLVIVAAGVFGAMFVNDQEWNTIGWIAIGAIGAILIIWLFLVPFIRWQSTHFVVTNERVMYRAGVLHRTGVDIPLNRINSVRFEHSLIDRVLGCGTLIIESASDEALTFDDVPQVERVHGMLYQQIDEGDQGDFYYPQRSQQPRRSE